METPSKIILVLSIWFAMALVAFWLWRVWRQSKILDRLAPDDQAPTTQRQHARGVPANFVSRWLFVAGFRSPNATWMFCLATCGSVLLGVVTLAAIYASGVRDSIVTGVAAIPGGVGEMFIPLAIVLPWFSALLLGLIPWLAVRSRRRTRVQMIEQDLPLALELLATLSEAGLGFDSGVSRVLSTRLAGRPLAEELRTFQADLLAGRPRTAALRRLSDRVQVSTMSIFVSAMVQAEQLGMGIAGVLRTQADEIRSRRRERAVGFAAALPVKRMLPLVVCFLPGLFVWTLGPFFVQVFKIADSFLEVQNL